MLLSDKFICAGEEYSTMQRRIPAPLFQKDIALEQAITKAGITVCGLGFYELYLNGKNITRGRLSPYITNSEQVVYYDYYDITALLTKENRFEFLLGNGMQNAFGGFIWEFEKAANRSSPKLAFAIEIAYADGSKKTVEADESVLVAESPVLSDDLRLGEIYDANKTEREWKPATVTRTPRGKKVLSSVPPITVAQELKPVRIFKEDDAYIYDFGINTAGVCRLQCVAQQNQKIRLTYAEILKNGRFYTDNTTFEHCKEQYFQSDTYICKEGKNDWQPTFTYHGFRYVKVEGVTAQQATPELLTYLVFHTALENIGYFSCSDEALNKLHAMTLNATLSNFHHFPTDCPQREKNGWTADAALSSAHTLLYYDAAANYKQWLIGICAAQNEQGALPGIVPTWGWGFEWGNGPAWDSVLTELPYQILQKNNDLSAFEICKESILKYLNYLDTRKDENGLLAIGLGDWCAPAHKLKTPLILTDSIEAFDIADKSAKMFCAAGEESNAERCSAFASKMRSSIRTHLFDSQTGVFADGSQTAQAMGIYYGITEGNEKNRAFQVLLQRICEDDYHIATGVLGARVLFHLLAENGEVDTAVRILKNPTAPSYMQWVLAGDTALCEGFDESNGLASHNHHFWGNISAFFMEQICGIRINADTIDILPRIPCDMQYARASCRTVFGKVSVSWKKEKSGISFEIEYPEKANGVFRCNNESRELSHTPQPLRFTVA